MLNQQKNVVITGGNSGVGFETAKQLSIKGYNVIFGSRNIAKNEQAVQEIIQQGGKNIKSFSLDLSVRKSVEDFARYVKESFATVDILVNNAGLVMGEQLRRNEDGIEMTLAINHFGHFYLTYLLWDQIKKSKEARVINVSSMGHYYAKENFLEDIKCETKEYKAFDQYPNSKLFNVLFAVGLSDRCAEMKLNHIKAFSLHPGVVDSGFYDRLTQESCFYSCLKKMCCCFLITNETGARTQLHLCQAPFAELRTGEYYNDDTRWKEMDPRGRNKELVNRLWRMSEEVYGIRFLGSS